MALVYKSRDFFETKMIHKKQRGEGDPKIKAIIIKGLLLTVYSVEDESFLQQDINCLHQRELTHNNIHSH